jgi:hypothetical protein
MSPTVTKIACFDCGAEWKHHCLCHILYGNGYLVEYSDGGSGSMGTSDSNPGGSDEQSDSTAEVRQGV